ncbi:TPA: LysR family transcriptional regulator [Klebsiella pneumoniae]|nr:LysR family transcriptional regulator [Klebsiella pneumoniae]HBV9252967.1 LysR family transcriptional regulator [Klebsiella pneumoniae]
MKHLQTYRFIRTIARTGSIRSAAELLNITPSALTRRVLDFEDELGTAIFERIPQGVRLNAAGLMLLRYINDQLADFDQLRSEITSLANTQSGHVELACSQAFIGNFVPDQIAVFRRSNPGITFNVSVRDHADGVKALANFDADLALLLDPPHSTDLSILHSSTESLCAVMNSEHPLAAKERISLRECCKWPFAMPVSSLAIRATLNEGLVRQQLSPVIAVESGSLEFLFNYIVREPLLTFQIAMGVPELRSGLCVRQINSDETKPMRIVLAKLKNRAVSPAAQKFAGHLCDVLDG